MTTTTLPAPARRRAALPALSGPVRAADRDPLSVYLATRRSERTRDTMRQALDRAAHVLTAGQVSAVDLPWHELRQQHLAGLVATLSAPPTERLADGRTVYTMPHTIGPKGEPFSPQTINKLASAVKGVLREAWRLGLLPTDDYTRAIDVRGLKVPPTTRGRALTQKEVRRLRQSCGDDLAGRRDAALLAVLFAGGVRRNELVGVDLADWQPGDGRLVVRRAKGGAGAKREVYLRNGAAEALKAWVEVRGSEPGPLFLGVRHGRLGSSRLTPQAVYDLLSRMAVRAGVSAFSPHDLRRTCASTMLEEGADLFAVQQHLGHASPTTTARYDRRGEKAKQAAASLLHFPF